MAVGGFNLIFNLTGLTSEVWENAASQQLVN